MRKCKEIEYNFVKETVCSDLEITLRMDIYSFRHVKGQVQRYTQTGDKILGSISIKGLYFATGERFLSILINETKKGIINAKVILHKHCRTIGSLTEHTSVNMFKCFKLIAGLRMPL